MHKVLPGQVLHATGNLTAEGEEGLGVRGCSHGRPENMKYSNIDYAKAQIMLECSK